MAEMVPDRLPSRASKGEERVFEILKRLPDDFIVYYEPIIESRYPDFIVIAPTLGILVIEVKGWYPRDICSADNNLVLVNEEGRQVRRAHPVRQAREYMLSLMDRCKTINRRQEIYLQVWLGQYSLYLINLFALKRHCITLKKELKK